MVKYSIVYDNNVLILNKCIILHKRALVSASGVLRESSRQTLRKVPK